MSFPGSSSPALRPLGMQPALCMTGLSAWRSLFRLTLLQQPTGATLQPGAHAQLWPQARCPLSAAAYANTTASCSSDGPAVGYQLHCRRSLQQKLQPLSTHQLCRHFQCSHRLHGHSPSATAAEERASQPQLQAVTHTAEQLPAAESKPSRQESRWQRPAKEQPAASAAAAASAAPTLNAAQQAAAFSDISKPLLIIAGETRAAATLKSCLVVPHLQHDTAILPVGADVISAQPQTISQHALAPPGQSCNCRPARRTSKV